MSNLNPDSFGKVRVLVAGNSGSGKTSLSELIATGKPQERPSSTAGCSVHIKLVEYAEPSGSQQRYFVELLDIGAHSRYEALRKSFYQQLNGVILVHDINAGAKAATLDRWAMEISEHGTFAAALPHEVSAANIGGLPVPILILYNKADKKRRLEDSSLPERVLAQVQEALQRWASQGLKRSTSMRRRSNATLTDTENSIAGLHTSAVEGSFDRAAVDAFFAQLIERRYYGGLSRPGGHAVPSHGVSGFQGTVGIGGHQKLEIRVQGGDSDLEGRLDYDYSPGARGARLDWAPSNNSGGGGGLLQNGGNGNGTRGLGSAVSRLNGRGWGGSGPSMGRGSPLATAAAAGMALFKDPSAVLSRFSSGGSFADNEAAV